MVEFALIAPIFFLFVAMVIQGALYINAQATIDNATREGARAAAICGSGNSNVSGAGAQGCQAMALAAVQDNLGILSKSTVRVTLCQGDTTTGARCSAAYVASGAGTVVEVDVSYVYRYYLDPLLGSGGPTTTITSSGRAVSQQ